jgi:chloramphenicol O-acetyltransferase type A
VSRAINARSDYRMFHNFKKDEVHRYDRVNPTHYVSNPKTETCHIVNAPYDPDYAVFYKRVLRDTEDAKKNYIELPDGYLYFNLNVNWGKPFEKDRKGLLPLTIRLNHAIADGYPISKFFLFLKKAFKGLSPKTGPPFGEDLKSSLKNNPNLQRLSVFCHYFRIVT